MPQRTESRGSALLERACRAAARARRPELALRAVAAALRVAFPGARVDVLARRAGAWSTVLRRPRGAAELEVERTEAAPRAPSRRRLAGGDEDLAGDSTLRREGYEHRLLVPLRTKEVRAIVSVAGTGTEPTRSALEAARELATLLVPPLVEIARLERSHRARERARLIQRFTASVNRSLELDEVLHAVVVRLRARVRFDRAELAVVVGQGPRVLRRAVDASDQFDQVAADSTDAEVLPVFPTGEDDEIRVDEDLAPLTEDPSAWDLLARGCRSRIAVRLVARRRFVGVLTLARRARSLPGRETLVLLRDVTRPLAVAVDNARLHRDTRRRWRQMTALYEVAQALSSVADTSGVTERVLSVLHDSFEFRHSAVLNLETDPDGVPWLVMQASRGYSPRGGGAFRMRVGDRGITSRAARERRLVYVPDVRRDASYVPGIEQGRSEVAVPLEANGNLIGVLDVESPEVAAFSDEDLETLKLFAVQVALALERARLFEDVRRQAMTDSLTGLLNQRYFQQALEREMDRSGRTGRPFVVALVDIDDFKRVNDEHGHVAGNAVIQAIGDALRSRARSIDAAARFGGDEFALMLSETDEAAGLVVLRAVQESLRARPAEAGLPPFSVSIGLAAWRPGMATVHDVVAAADEALYRAKDLGKDRCVAAEGGAA